MGEASENTGLPIVCHRPDDDRVTINRHSSVHESYAIQRPSGDQLRLGYLLPAALLGPLRLAKADPFLRATQSGFLSSWAGLPTRHAKAIKSPFGDQRGGV
jgi:hypothetical protein